MCVCEGGQIMEGCVRGSSDSGVWGRWHTADQGGRVCGTDSAGI